MRPGLAIIPIDPATRIAQLVAEETGIDARWLQPLASQLLRITNKLGIKPSDTRLAQVLVNTIKDS